MAAVQRNCWPRWERPLDGWVELASQVTTTKPYRWTSACAVGFDQRIRSRATESFREAIDFGIKRPSSIAWSPMAATSRSLPADSDGAFHSPRVCFSPTDLEIPLR